MKSRERYDGEMEHRAPGSLKNTEREGVVSGIERSELHFRCSCTVLFKTLLCENS